MNDSQEFKDLQEAMNWITIMFSVNIKWHYRRKSFYQKRIPRKEKKRLTKHMCRSVAKKNRDKIKYNKTTGSYFGMYKD